MEILLNFAWAASAIAIVAFWLHTAKQSGSNRQGQMIAIAVLVAILFPVISVSDDLMAAQCPSETDNYSRRDHLLPSDAPPLLPVVAKVPPPAFTAIALCFLHYVSPVWTARHLAPAPKLASVQNRPPPEA